MMTPEALEALRFHIIAISTQAESPVIERGALVWLVQQLGDTIIHLAETWLASQ